MTEKTLVTCAAGNVGRRVVQSLLDKGKPVRAGVHHIETASQLFGDGVPELAAMDFGDPESIKEAVAGVACVCLITPHSSQQVEWALRVIDLAAESGVRKIVRLSGLAVEFEPKVQVGRWMEAVENALKQSPLGWTIVRPSPFMHNFFGFYPKAGSVYWPPIGDGKINHIHVQDVADVLAEVIVDEAYAGKTLTITGGQALTMKQAAGILAASWQRDVDYQPVTEEEARQRLSKAGKPAWLVEVLMELYRAFGSGAAARVETTTAEILRRPPMRFEQFADSCRDRPEAH